MVEKSYIMHIDLLCVGNNTENYVYLCLMAENDPLPDPFNNVLGFALISAH